MKKVELILMRFKGLLESWIYKLSSHTIKLKIGAFLSVLEPYFIALLLMLGVVGCKSTNLPIMESSVIVKDSIVEVHDTITIEVPRESISIVTQDTVSYLKTSLAESIAKVEGGVLHHSLKQQGELKTVVDTFYITKTKESTFYVPKVVEVEKKYIPKWVYGSLLINALVALIIVLKLKK